MQDRAAKGGGTATDITPGFLQRAVQGVRYLIEGVTPSNFFGPGQPLPPASQESAGRAFDYPTSVNLHITPRQTEAVSFATMRALADNYDLLRIVIETTKDRLCRMKWQYTSTDPENKNAQDPRLKVLRDFFASPDQEHDWITWYRILLEDLFVIDAPTIYVRKTKGGLTGKPRPFALEIIDGATIARKIDVQGRTPLPPSPAYQQIIKGLPTVDYTTQELLYLPKNKRSHKLYGFSHVEQIIMTVNIALRRQLHQLEFYTEGNTPDLLMKTPESWTAQQIQQLQLFWDTLTDTATRRKGRFIPGGCDPYDTKQKELKDEFDEWLARIVCYHFSQSPQPFVKEMNRATAQTAAETAKEEGLEPILTWTKSLKDRIIREHFGWPDLEATWEMERELDPKTKSEIDDRNVKNGTATINEVRKHRGQDPVEGGDKPILYTSAGGVLLTDAIAKPEPEEPKGPQGAEPGEEPPTPPAKKIGKENEPPVEERLALLESEIERLKKKALSRSTAADRPY